MKRLVFVFISLLMILNIVGCTSSKEPDGTYRRADLSENERLEPGYFVLASSWENLPEYTFKSAFHIVVFEETVTFDYEIDGEWLLIYSGSKLEVKLTFKQIDSNTLIIDGTKYIKR